MVLPEEPPVSSIFLYILYIILYTGNLVGEFTGRRPWELLKAQATKAIATTDAAADEDQEQQDRGGDSGLHERAARQGRTQDSA